MGLEDMTNKAKQFATENADKVKDAMNSEQAEGISDKVLDGASDFVNKITGGKFADKVNDVRDNIDKQIGTE